MLSPQSPEYLVHSTFYFYITPLGHRDAHLRSFLKNDIGFLRRFLVGREIIDVGSLLINKPSPEYIRAYDSLASRVMLLSGGITIDSERVLQNNFSDGFEPYYDFLMRNFWETQKNPMKKLNAVAYWMKHPDDLLMM